jgi:hypothetical protein
MRKKNDGVSSINNQRRRKMAKDDDGGNRRRGSGCARSASNIARCALIFARQRAHENGISVAARRAQTHRAHIESGMGETGVTKSTGENGGVNWHQASASVAAQ